MPLRNWCITTCFIQIFSFVTFLGLWTNTSKEVMFVQEDFVKNNKDYLRSTVLELKGPKCNNVSDSKLDPLIESCLPIRGISDVCYSYFLGEKVSIEKTQVKLSPKCRLHNLADNCQMLKLAHGYETFPVSEEERQYPLAFAIKLHRLPEQAERLLRTIYRAHNVYCIYVDGKAPKVLLEIMNKISRCFPNVHVVQDPINVVYASSAHMQSELQCMKTVSRTNVQWKYYINLAGQEYPLKSNFEILKILQALNGANDIESYTLPVFLKWRYDNVHGITSNKITDTKLKKKQFKYNLQMSKGSAYGAFTRDFVNFLLTDDVVQDYITWLNDTYSPEENVWATMNTLPWAPGGYLTEVRQRYGTFLSRAIIWEHERIKCTGKYIRGVCVFSRTDLPWLVGQKQLFANKFDEYQDKVVLDCMESWIRNKTKNPAVHLQDWYFYRNVPHGKFYSALSDIQKDKDFLFRQKDVWLQNQRNQMNYTLIERDKAREKDLNIRGSSINVYQVYDKGNG